MELTATSAPPGLPACTGRRFKFPADLADSKDHMCQAHRKEADTLAKRRMALAEASNPAGWRMMADASARLSLPQLPGGLATRLKENAQPVMLLEILVILEVKRCKRRISAHKVSSP